MKLVENTPEACPQQNYNIFLVKDGITQAADILKNEKKGFRDIKEIPLEEGLKGTAFVYLPEPRQVGFMKVLRQVCPTLPDYQSRSGHAAVILVHAHERVFAFVWGQGHHQLKKAHLVPGFGLRVALGSIGPNQIKGMETQELNKNSLRTLQKLGRKGYTHDFRLKEMDDLVKRIKGQVMVNGTMPVTIDGRESVKLSLPVQLPDIEPYLNDLLEAYEEPLPAHFQFTQRLFPLDDYDLIQDLDDLLLQDLLSDEPETYLSAPDLAGMEGGIGFEFRRYYRQKKVTLYSELSLEDYLVSLGDKIRKGLSLENLKSHSVYGIHEDTVNTKKLCSVYEAMIYEVDDNNRTYILNGGLWYGVNHDIYRRINTFYNQQALPDLITYHTVILPKDNKDKINLEAEMNRKMTDNLGDAICLDARNVQLDSRDKFEACDIMRANGDLIHVKRMGSSQSLGHLFNQGKQATRLLDGSKEARKKMRGVLEREDRNFVSLIPKDRPNGDDYRIIFAIAEEGDGPLKIPFFARQTLYYTFRGLKDLGYKPVLAKIPTYRQGDRVMIDGAHGPVRFIAT